MVYVRLAQGWTDGGGAAYAAGDMVDVDAVTLAELEAKGVVATTDKVDGDEVEDEVRAAWPGLTTPRPGGDHGDAWPGLTTPRPDGNGDRKPEKAEKAPSPDGTGTPDGDGTDAWPGLT